MAITLDLSDSNNIHPPNKHEVGRRLTLLARYMLYGEDLVYSGPIFDSLNRESDMIRVMFKHIGGKLVIN